MTLLRLAAILLLGASASASELEFRVVDEAGAPLEHAVVTLRVSGEKAAPDTSDVAVSQTNQQFNPRVLVVARGSRVRFPNRDITQHHVYSFSEAKTFELELYSGDDVQPVEFPDTGIVALGCNIHDWMLGYVYVTDDAQFAVTGADGRVSFDVDVAEVETVTFWHPASVSDAPASRAFETGVAELAIETRDVDPLHFEIDPLQDLFSTARP